MRLNFLSVSMDAMPQMKAARAFERCGFVREGLLRGQVFCDGKEEDLILLGRRAADRRKDFNRADPSSVVCPA